MMDKGTAVCFLFLQAIKIYFSAFQKKRNATDASEKKLQFQQSARLKGVEIQQHKNIREPGFWLTWLHSIGKLRYTFF